MNCLVFGDKSLPCEANFAVIRTTEDNEEHCPEAVAAVRRDIFVDDFYTSRASVEHAVNLHQDVTALMGQGGFPMRKWLSSSAKVLSSISEAEQVVSSESLEMGKLPSGRALGLRWDVQSDTLGFTLVHIDRPPAPPTKHRILCRLAGLYDPLGWASPFILRAKVMLQRTWA